MAYPEPTPALRGRKAKEFVKRLESFKLTPGQKRLYRDARKHYNKLRPKE